MKTTNNKKSKFLALLLSVMMLSSMGAAFAACTDNDDSSSSSSSSSSTTENNASDRVDNGTIKNSHFDFTTLSDTVKIGTSVTGWTRAVNSATTGSAPSSKSASGVVDTAKDAWNDLTTRNKTDEDIADMKIKDAVDAWDTFTTADKLAFYENWEGRPENKKLDIDEEFEKYKEDSYESFNIDYEDLPIGLANPGTPDKQPDKDEKGEGRDVDTQILMLHNNNSIGTAQKYTSSSTVTVTAGSAAKVTLWVKTAELTTVDSNKQEQDAVGKGAYINVTQTVGSKTLDTFEVKNIQAAEWTEYTFYLKGSSFADTKFTIVLGLGQGGGTDHLGYVNGYAFFDNIQYSEISRDDYDKATEAVDGEVFLASEKKDKTVDAYTSSATTFAMNFYDTKGNASDGWEIPTDAFQSTSAAVPTKSTDGPGKNDELLAKVNDKDVMTMFANRTAIKDAYANNDNDFLRIVYNEYLADKDDDNDFVKNDQEIFMMLSTQGAAYTWEGAFEFVMPKDTNAMAISFFVKTFDFGEGNGVTVTLKNDRNDDSTSTFSSLNTANLSGVTVGGVEDFYDGWQRCYFFIEKSDDIKEQEKDDGNGTTFTLDFNYGPTSLSISTPESSFVPGFAAFTKFQTLEMTSLEYSCATASTYAQKYTLTTKEEDKAAGNAGFDAAANTPSDALDKGLANAQNYKGVYSDSFYVQLPDGSVEDDDDRRKVNTYENAGLLNRNNFTDPENDIVTENAGKAWMEGLKSISGKTDATEIWNAVFGNSTQPLFIWNDGVGEKSYGYVGTSTTLSSAYTAISLRVKTGGGAKASIYLVDMNDETHQTVFSVSNKLTYWYDDNGNVLTEEDGKVALRLDKKTGLYKIDSKWNKAEYEKGEYYANLQAYTVGEDGNLYANENSATHAYHSSDWDRIVYYKHTDGAYYTQANGQGYKVKDFSEVSGIKTRYDGTGSANLCVENLDTDGKWVNVTFYVKKGNETKNYRLEVWSSATRAGAINPANSYVAVDMNNPGTASSLYSGLLDEYKDEVPEGKDKFEGVFSYYDTDKHVRYEAALEEAYAEANDVKVVGNLYKDSFTASSYESAIAYLRHVDATDGDISIFVDYSLSEQGVVAAIPDTDDDDTDTDTDTDTDEDGMNVFMLVSSISVAAALLVAIGGIATQRIIKYVKKRKAAKAHVNVVKKTK